MSRESLPGRVRKGGAGSGRKNQCCRHQVAVKVEPGLSVIAPSSRVSRLVYDFLRRMHSPLADDTDNRTIPEKLS